MRRIKRVLTFFLSMALMLSMVIPVAFADDTPKPEDTGATVNTEREEATEEVAEDPVQAADDTFEEANVQEEVITEEAEDANNSFTIDEISLDEDEIAESKAKLRASNKDRKILIAGLDNGGRADIIIIVCFTKDNEAKVFTVARDTYMQLNPSQKYNIDGKIRDYCKCNRASSYGNMYILRNELNRHLDLDIDKYIGVDWSCAAALIDKIGGLRVNLTDKDMVARMNANSDIAPGHPEKVTLGKQTLTGWQAVQFLRVRKYEGGSARVRESRNLDVFMQIYKSAQTWNDAKKEAVYNVIQGKIQTNMSMADIKSLYSLIKPKDNKGVELEKASPYPYYSKTYWDKWADYDYLVPVTLEKNTTMLHKTVLGQSSYKASTTVKNLSKTIAKHIKKKTIVAKKPKLPSVAKAKVTIGVAAYTGKEVKPSVTVKLKKKKLKATCYTLTYKNNINIGKASIIIEGQHGYGGSKTVTFDIKPAGTSLIGVTAGPKSFTATWKMQSAQMPKKTIDGYQIQYGRKKSFKKAKTLTVSGYQNTTATVGKLKAKKKYYVRVRTYVGSGKNAVYSDWSSAKTVKPAK